MIKKEKGITLIALVITIIILLILAGITIATITSDNGIIKNANEAKEQTEIAEEKEIVDMASLQAMGNNKRGNLVKEELQEQLDKITDNGKTEVSDNGEEFEIVFVDSNRYYTVDKEGNIIEEGKVVIDKSPGDITKDENGNDIEEGQPYEIWCIEDLIEWSQNYKNYKNSNIILGRTLDFKSNYSYTNGKMLGCNSIEELKELLTNTEGTGFTPINIFTGIFDGQGYEIQNVYINAKENIDIGGLFVAIGEPTKITVVKNIIMTGNIIGIKSVGGIIGCTNNVDKTGKVLIENCINKCTLKYNINPSGIIIEGVGGILGKNNLANTTDTVQIKNCKNYGTIDSISENFYSGIGGIAGCDYYNGLTINKCYNEGIINGNEINTAGIIGRGGKVIINSWNCGKVKGSGIAGRFCFNLYNCYNIGETTLSGILRGENNSNVVINNVYTTSFIGDKPIVYANISSSNSTVTNAFYSEQCTYKDTYGTAITEENMKANEQNEKSLISLLNSYVQTYNEKNKNNENFIELSYWKIDSKSGYPTFE